MFSRKLPKEHDYRLYCLFRTNRYSVNSAIGSRFDGILFCSFWNQNGSQKNTITVNSVYSHSRIVPKQRTLDLDIIRVRRIMGFEKKSYLPTNRRVGKFRSASPHLTSWSMTVSSGWTRPRNLGRHFLSVCSQDSLTAENVPQFNLADRTDGLSSTCECCVSLK